MNEQHKEKSGCSSIFKTGCLVIAVLLVGVVGVGGYYINSFWNKAEEFITEKGGVALVLSLKKIARDMDLPPQERETVMATLDGLARKFDSGQIEMNQFMQIGQNLMTGPFVQILLVKGFKSKYIDKSQLPLDEKSNALVTLERFIYGLSKGLVSKEQVEQLTYLISEKSTVKQEDGEVSTEYKLKDTLSPEELKNALDHMEVAVNNAGVPGQGYQIDFAAQLELAIEKGLQGSSS